MVFPFSWTLVKPLCFSHGACCPWLNLVHDHYSMHKVPRQVTVMFFRHIAKNTSPESWCDLNRNAPCFGGDFLHCAIKNVPKVRQGWRVSIYPSRPTWIFTRLWNWPRLMRSRSSAGEKPSWLNHTEHLKQQPSGMISNVHPLVYNPVNYFDWTFPGYTNDQLESKLDGLYCPP